MRARRWASAAASWTLPACALVTIVLGLWGWLDYGLRFDNALYKAIALFTINNQAYRTAPGSSDLRFLIGRWTGLFSVFGAALFALGALLQQQAVLALAQMVRRRVVIVGAGDLAQKAFDSARQGGGGAIWLGAPALDADRLSAFALPWPVEDLERAVAAYAGEARQVLVAQDDPAASLVLVRAARAAAPDAWITALLNDASLAEDAAAMINQPRTRILSSATLSARALHIAHPPFLRAREAGHGRIHALIVGFGQSGQAIAHDLIVNCRTTYLGLPRITVVDPDARALEGAWRARAPELDQCAEIAFVAGRIGTQGVEPGLEALLATVAAGGPVTAAYVCRRLDADSLSSAATLRSLLRLGELGLPPIFTRLRDAHTLTEGGREGAGLDALIPFGDIGAIVAASEFLSPAPDAAARAFSDAYRATRPDALRNDRSRRASRPWDELDETFRQVTRDAVAHIPAKLASGGVDPALWVGTPGPPKVELPVRLFTTMAERETLAALEHERWNAQRRMDGWRWADLPAKDEQRRLHPALVPYERLSETSKAYDRALVEETQAICRRVGVKGAGDLAAIPASEPSAPPHADAKPAARLPRAVLE